MFVQYNEHAPSPVSVNRRREDYSQTKSLPPLPPKDVNRPNPTTSTTSTISSSNNVIDNSAISNINSISSSCRTATTVFSENDYKEESVVPEEKEFMPMYDHQQEKHKSLISNGSSKYDLSYYFYSATSNNNSTSTTTNTYTSNDSAKNDYSPHSRRRSGALHRERSLSICSTISTHHYTNSPSSSVGTATSFSEYHDNTPNINKSFSVDPLFSCKAQQHIYDKYNKKSNKNATTYQFFGEQQTNNPLEISAKEIKREGLKSLLFSTIPLGYFLYHLLNEYSSENLFFFLAVENYQNCIFANDAERQQTASKIAKVYLTRNADLEINLEDKIYRSVKAALLEQQRQPSISIGNEFDAAKRHVFGLLNVSYHRFRTSSIWDIMESKCNAGDMNNRERSQTLVVNILLSYIKRIDKNTSLHKLVHSFCKIYLPLGYEARSSSSCSSSKEEKVIIKESSSNNRRSRSKSVGGSDKKDFIKSKLDIIFFKSSNKKVAL